MMGGNRYEKKSGGVFRRMVNGKFAPYLIMVLPLFLLYLVLTVVTTSSTFLFSFTDFDGLSIKNFNWMGFQNYKVAFMDKTFWMALKNTILYAVAVTLIQNFLGLLLALGLNKKMKSANFLRTLLFTPAIISTVVISYAFTYIYDTNGLINIILRFFHLDGLARTWLGEPSLALVCVAISNIWRFLGYSAVIFIANMQSISTDVLEASSIDGASGFQKFRYITFPLLAPSVTINLTLSFIGCLKVFDTVYTMTGGGPGNYSEVIGTYILKLQGQNLNGYACALAVILTLIILGLNLITFPYLKRRENY